MPPLKKQTLGVPRMDQLRPSVLPKNLAGDDEMATWVPLVKDAGNVWEEAVLCIMAEDYCCFDAQIVGKSYKMIEGEIHSKALVFKGKCPLCDYAHHSNHWVLINTRGHDTTLFICHHSGQRRVIQNKLPFGSKDC
jgi:hypothetical protein